MSDTKKPWLSKTLWVNAIMAVLALAYPPAHEWMAAHPDVVIYGFAVINMALRLITKDKLAIGE